MSKLAIPPFAPNLLVSGGGDEELFVWDFATGTLLHKLDLYSCVKNLPTVEDVETPPVFLDIVSVAALCFSNETKELTVLLEG